MNAGELALPAMTEYLLADRAFGYGSASFVGAAIKLLGGRAPDVEVTAKDRDTLTSMLGIGRKLAGYQHG